MSKEIEQNIQRNLENPLSYTTEVKQLTQLIDKRTYNGQKATVSIAGQSASGKTTLSKLLEHRYARETNLIQMDNYLLGWEVGLLDHDSGDESKPFFAGLNPNVYDLEKLEIDLQQLEAGNEINLPVFDPLQSKRVGFKKLHPKQVLIIDGIYAFKDRFGSLADIKVLVEAELHDRLIRKIFRNTSTHEESVNHIVSTYLNRDEPTYKYHRQGLIEQADIVVTNKLNPEFELAQLKALSSADVEGEKIKAVLTDANQDLSLFIHNESVHLYYAVADKALLYQQITKETAHLLSKYYQFKVENI